MMKRRDDMQFQTHNPKIFIIGGKARSGKDTVGKLIHEYYSEKKVINLQYSYYIKEYAKRLSDWDGRDETKPRQLLCDLGTDLIRKQIDYLFFINRMIEDIKVYQYFFDIIVISDARLKEEFTILKEQFDQVITIGLTRPNYDNQLTDTIKTAITETDLDDFHEYDYEIVNDGSLDELKEKVENLIEEVEK